MSKLYSTLIVLFILAAVVMLIYSIIAPVPNDKFTEFYILGIYGDAASYPTNFTMNNGQVLSVQYGNVSLPVNEKYGGVMLDIVNHEQQQKKYTIIMHIEGNQVNIPFQGNEVSSIGPIELTSGEKWEEEIGIVPQHAGANQEVELFLFKDGETEAYLTLHLWINVTQQ